MVEKHESAYQDYLNGMKYKDIAEKYEVSLSTVKSWKTRYAWQKGTQKVRDSTRPQNMAGDLDAKLLMSVEQNDRLTDKQKLFCVCYLKNFNATQAAINAGYSPDTAMVTGYENLRKPNIKAEIQRLKAIKSEAILASQDDIVERFMNIAFSDITDFVDFFTEQAPLVIGGRLVTTKDAVTGEPIPVTKTVNAIRFKDAAMVDGGLICEISQGKDGAKIKLEDRQKALDWLAKYFLMNPMDRHKIEYDRQKLVLDSEAGMNQPIDITIFSKAGETHDDGKDKGSEGS